MVSHRFSIPGRQDALRSSSLAVPIDPTERRARTRSLWLLSVSHLINDTLPSVLFALFPILKVTFSLSYAEVGFISLAYQTTASFLQPLIGHFADKRPRPSMLCIALSLGSFGAIALATSRGYSYVLFAAMLIGLASSMFHPIASPLVRQISGGQYGFGQSVFQLGGNAGAALGPLLAALIIIPRGLQSLLLVCIPTIFVIALCFKFSIQFGVGVSGRRNVPASPSHAGMSLRRKTVTRALLVLLVLMFSKYIYLTGMCAYYPFYLIHRFGLSAQDSQLYLFLFLFAMAAGTLIGGPIVDRVGCKPVIWVSILGVAPFSVLLPYVSLVSASVISFIIGLVLSSAFSAILVFAQELLPHRVGLVSGLFFGIAVGFGGVGATLLGVIADHFGIVSAFKVCSYLPILGIATMFLPSAPAAQRLSVA